MNNFHVIVKQITKFDGRRADEFLERDSKLHTSLSVYNTTIFNILQGQEQPSKFDADQETTRDLRCRKSRPMQRALLHHSQFGVLRGSEISGQNTG